MEVDYFALKAVYQLVEYFIIEDQNYRMSPDEIKRFFLYREKSHKEQISAKHYEEIMSCQELNET